MFFTTVNQLNFSHTASYIRDKEWNELRAYFSKTLRRWVPPLFEYAKESPKIFVKSLMVIQRISGKLEAIACCPFCGKMLKIEINLPYTRKCLSCDERF